MKNKRTTIIVIVSLLMLFSTIGNSQIITIKGSVKDETNSKSLGFTNVYFTKALVGTITNNSGEFILHVNKNVLPDTLTFSRIGYFTKKIKISTIKDTLITLTLKPRIYTTQSIVEVKAKKTDPLDVFKKTYEFYKAHQKDTFLVDFYVREVINYNNKFIYEAKGFLKGYMSEKINLSNKTRLIKGNLVANDSLLYLYGNVVPTNDVSFYSVYGFYGIGELMKKLQKPRHKKINIDTVMIDNDEKLYVLHFYNDNYRFDNKKNNINLLLNKNSIDLMLNNAYILNYMKKQCVKNSQFVFYIENKKNVYLVKKIKILHPCDNTSKHPTYFYEEYNYLSNKDNEIIPNYTKMVYGYMQNDTALYIKYSDCIITSFHKAHTIDEINFKNIYASFPTYLYEKKHNESIKQNSNFYTPDLNYIKEDTLEKLVKKDLYGKNYSTKK